MNVKVIFKVQFFLSSLQSHYTVVSYAQALPLTKTFFSWRQIAWKSLLHAVRVTLAEVIHCLRICVLVRPFICWFCSVSIFLSARNDTLECQLELKENVSGGEF